MHPVTSAGACPQDWYRLPAGAERDRCAEQKHNESVRQDAQERAAKALTPWVQTWPGFTPQKLPKPTDHTAPEAIPLVNGAGGPALMRYATSVWWLDYVANAAQTLWGELFVVAYSGEGTTPAMVQTYVLNKFTEDMGQYEHLWRAPAPVGELTITSISGRVGGVVPFRSATSQTGQLDMTTGNGLFSPAPQK